MTRDIEYYTTRSINVVAHGGEAGQCVCWWGEGRRKGEGNRTAEIKDKILGSSNHILRKGKE